MQGVGCFRPRNWGQGVFGFRVQGFGVQGFGFRVSNFGLKVQNLWLTVQGSGVGFCKKVLRV